MLFDEKTLIEIEWHQICYKFYEGLKGILQYVQPKTVIKIKIKKKIKCKLWRRLTDWQWFHKRGSRTRKQTSWIQLQSGCRSMMDLVRWRRYMILQVWNNDTRNLKTLEINLIVKIILLNLVYKIFSKVLYNYIINKTRNFLAFCETYTEQ
jgi:hypothetical protein